MVGYTEKDTRDKIFTFQSGYIQMLLFVYYYMLFDFFTFQSGYIQIANKGHNLEFNSLYIPIWLYSNPSISYHLFMPLEKHFFVDR